MGSSDGPEGVGVAGQGNNVPSRGHSWARKEAPQWEVF